MPSLLFNRCLGRILSHLWRSFFYFFNELPQNLLLSFVRFIVIILKHCLHLLILFFILFEFKNDRLKIFRILFLIFQFLNGHFQGRHIISNNVSLHEILNLFFCKLYICFDFLYTLKITFNLLFKKTISSTSPFADLKSYFFPVLIKLIAFSLLFLSFSIIFFS